MGLERFSTAKTIQNYFISEIKMGGGDMGEVASVPINLKAALTIREAAEYSNIGINRIDRMLRTPNCPFVLFVGTKKLVKRREFEEFISSRIVI